MKEAVRERIWVAGQCQRFVTATEMVRELRIEARDPLREVKKRIEELRDEGRPIVGLPSGKTGQQGSTLGPGYTWVHEAGSEWGREVIRRFKADMGSRIKQMRDHLMVLEQCSASEAQTELFEGLKAG